MRGLNSLKVSKPRQRCASGAKRGYRTQPKVVGDRLNVRLEKIAPEKVSSEAMSKDNVATKSSNIGPVFMLLVFIERKFGGQENVDSGLGQNLLN